MRGIIRLIGFIVALLWPILPALAGPMEAQPHFSEWVQEFNGTSIDFNELAPGILLDTLYASKAVRSGVVF